MSNLTRRQFLRVSALATAGAALAACGKKATTVAPTQPAAPVTAATAVPVAQATATPSGPVRPTTWPLGDVPRNRTLIYYNNTSSNGNCNPFAAGYTHQNGNAILIEPGAFYGVHADKEYLWLAESYKYSTDAKQCTVTFRKGIKWSDGSAFTANDIATSMMRLKKVNGLNRGGPYQMELDNATAVDDVTLQVNLNQPDWRFFFTHLTFRFDLGDETAFIPNSVWKDVPDDQLITFKWFDATKKWPLTTGPYGISTSNEQITNYDLWPSWWAVDTGFVKDYPGPWRITQQTFTNATMAAQLLINKEVDHTLDLRPFVCASTLAQADWLTTWTGRKPPYGYMDWWPISVQFCTTKAPVDNPQVRWAISYGLDKQKVVDIGWGGAGTTDNSPFPGYPKLVKYMEGIKDITDQYNVLEFNLDKSAALMGQAGFTKDSEGFWVDKDGKRPDLDLYADGGLFGDIAPIIAEQLRDSGFFCQHKSPPDVWAASTDGRASLFLYGHGGSTIDPYDTFYLYYNPGAPMGQQSGANITRWQNDDFKKITDEMNNTPMDDPKMADLFHQGMSIWYQNLPDCPVVNWYHRIPVNTWYWDNWPDENNPYMNTALWHETMLYVVLGLKATGKT